jgi:hypothetical protein
LDGNVLVPFGQVVGVLAIIVEVFGKRVTEIEYSTAYLRREGQPEVPGGDDGAHALPQARNALNSGDRKGRGKKNLNPQQ